ncbi:hypothetical protein GCM10027280_19500 [Micromonospora polyrhachis]|uniref:Thiopeptide-type bacteriocin biosynthesis protein n=1 Tax=Micromonospora polyrhachis TaxID=1282883 RepID=A0A7W7SLL4_9ACTN|nr:thiopeptide-type bacteriocin biosynthesis protein [Micromonospora polyrhachis]MBB4957044.1 thiopeptide-type bacteriocin biosynthesis protein [Micromonospora polyrhachis]
MHDNAVSIIVCGASAAVLFPTYAMQLRQQLTDPLRVLLTHGAERFVKPSTIAFFADEVYASDDESFIPTEFARRSRVIAVLPATAHTLASAALGLAGSPAQTALLAASGPTLYFPSMNRAMWQRESTRRHVATLRADGHVVIDPVEAGVYENWQRSVVRAPALPAPAEVAQLIAAAAAEAGAGTEAGAAAAAAETGTEAATPIQSTSPDLLLVGDPEPSDPWLQYNAEVDWATPELYDALRTDVTELLGDGTVADFFFVHKPPGLRLRYRIDPADRPAVAGRVTTLLDDLCRRGLVRGWLPAVYEPEQRLFGGAESMRSVHQVFTADSLAWLGFHADQPAAGQRPTATWAMSLLMIRELLDALGITGWEDIDVWDRLGRYGQRMLDTEVADDARVARIAAALRRDWAEPERLREQLPPTGPQLLDRWAQSMATIGKEWWDGYFTSPDAEVGPRHAAAFTIIFHWNRARLPIGQQALITHTLGGRMTEATA